MEVENYTVATSQIAQPRGARCWAGFATLMGRGCPPGYLHAKGAR
jgi:hypothetical protein